MAQPVPLQVDMYQYTRKITVSGDAVVYVETTETSGGFGSVNRVVPRTAGPSTAVRAPETASGSEVIGDFASDATSIYFGVLSEAPLAQGIYRCDVAACPTPTVIATGTGRVSIALQNGYVVWAETTTGDVKRRLETGGAPELVASGPGSPDNAVPSLLATDDSNVFVASSSGFVTTAPFGANGTMTTLFSHTRGFASIARTATDVFVADDNGAVLRCAKTGCLDGPTSIAPWCA